MDIIDQHPNQLLWDECLQVVTDDKPVTNSNVIEIFKFLMKNQIVTKQSNIPLASRDSYDKLQNTT